MEMYLQKKLKNGTFKEQFLAIYASIFSNFDNT